MNFKRNIKVTEAQYLYSGLSLIAEVGGYVGLFLGVSVNQITILVDKLFGYIDLWNHSHQIWKIRDGLNLQYKYKVSFNVLSEIFHSKCSFNMLFLNKALFTKM